MKKIVAVALLMLCVCGLAACRQDENEDALHNGINAEIVEIDADNQIVYVADIGTDTLFGKKCAVDCEKLIDNQKLIYVDYDTEEVMMISFSDLAIGDEVIIAAYEKQLDRIADGMIEVEQIQLATHRFDVE